ncbi:MAG: hypothetical protein P4L53_11220 [Candidatus Obscuribacterales bacterium]|nr:hypothetical protein [Candidatus Obscuribacterales bacterium]
MKNKAAIILIALMFMGALPVGAEVTDATASTVSVSTAASVPIAANAPITNGTTTQATLPVPSACAVISKVLEEQKTSKRKPSKSSNKDVNQKNAAEAAEILSIDSELEKNSERPTGPQEYKPLEGSATYTDINAFFGDNVNKLTKVALLNNPKYVQAAKAVTHYRTGMQKTIRASKDALNYVIPYRGFSMSMEGARVVLDQDQKVNNLFVAELVKQKMEDEMHAKVMVSMMQIAMGMGLKNPNDSQAAVNQGVEGLKKLTSDEQAASTLASMNEMKDQLNIPEGIFAQHNWDVDTTDRIYQKAVNVAANDDPLIDHIKTKAKKYIHSTAFNITASAVQSGLAAVTLLSGSPMISVGAEAASTAFVMATGGPEENKILAELYFGKRMEIRRKRIADEVRLAMSNYDKALMTHNGPQLAMSEIVLADLVGYENIPTVIERQAINDFGFPEPAVVAAPEAAKETVASPEVAAAAAALTAESASSAATPAPEMAPDTTTVVQVAKEATPLNQ